MIFQSTVITYFSLHIFYFQCLHSARMIDLFLEVARLKNVVLIFKYPFSNRFKILWKSDN